MMNESSENRAVSTWAVASWSRHLSEGSNDLGLLRRALTEGTISSVANESARRAPEKEAIRVDGVALTHAELDERARRTASWLVAQGVEPGHRVLLAAPTSVDFLVGYLATMHAGASATFANPLLTASELMQVVEDAEPTVAFVSPVRAEQLSNQSGRKERLKQVVTIGDDGADLEGVTDGYSPSPDICTDPKAEAHIAFTSGTTGRPKATPLTHENLLASIRSLMTSWEWSDTDTLIHALPMTHGHGLSGFQAVLASGGRGIFLSGFAPELLCNAIRDHRATILFAVPAMWERLLAWPEFPRAELSSLRFATSGSAPLPPATSDAVAEVLGQRPIERYGCTETGYATSNPYRGPRLAGTVGFPVPGAEVRIVDRDGHDVEVGSDGEIVVRGPAVFAGYLGVDNTDFFLPGGWFRTGDMGKTTDDGYLTITGRIKDMIISGGLNVYPKEVELALRRRSGVAAAAVVGVPSRRWGEEVVAFVVPGPNTELDVDDIMADMREELASYKCPKRVFVIDKLPENHMGKVLRRQLVEKAGKVSDA